MGQVKDRFGLDAETTGGTTYPTVHHQSSENTVDITQIAA